MFSKADLGSVDVVYEFNADHDKFEIDLASGLITDLDIQSAGAWTTVTVTGNFDGTGNETLEFKMLSPSGLLDVGDFLVV